MASLMERKFLRQDRSRKGRFLKSVAICFQGQATQSKLPRTASSPKWAICFAASAITNRPRQGGAASANSAPAPERAIGQLFRPYAAVPIRPHGADPERLFTGEARGTLNFTQGGIGRGDITFSIEIERHWPPIALWAESRSSPSRG